MSDRYACPDCGGEMWTIAKMSDPPIYEARCPSCGAVYRRDRNYAANPLPRSYVKVAPPAAMKDGDAACLDAQRAHDAGRRG